MSEKEYKKLLDKALSQLPTGSSKKTRFLLPKPTISTMGSRTILQNFKEVCDQLNRSENNLIKYLASELATAGTIEGGTAIFKGRFDLNIFTRLIERFAYVYVYCPVCNEPDTKIVKEGRFQFLVCDACGAKSPLKKL